MEGNVLFYYKIFEKTKRQKNKKTTRQKDKKTKRQKRQKDKKKEKQKDRKVKTGANKFKKSKPDQKDVAGALNQYPTFMSNSEYSLSTS